MGPSRARRRLRRVLVVDSLALTLELEQTDAPDASSRRPGSLAPRFRTVYRTFMDSRITRRCLPALPMVAVACGVAGEEERSRCGDGRPGVIQSNHGISYQEGCDDGNSRSGDGCDGSCLAAEHGWRCPVFGEPCEPICGDGNVAGDEICDSRLPLEGGYCSDCREVVPGVCGDGLVLEPFESCDDGNTSAFDGCDESCQPKTGFACEGTPSACMASGVPRLLQLGDLDADQRAMLCTWLVGTYGGPRAQHPCEFEGTPMFRLTVRTVSDCVEALSRGFLAGCPSGSCQVGAVEERVAASGASLCGPWMGV